MKTAQDILSKYTGGRVRGGFNCRLYGDTYSQIIQEHDQDAMMGWDCANEMINEGKVSYVHNFHSHSDCKGHAFTYGGKWACNTCNHDWRNPAWWVIKVFQENGEWWCVGDGFISQAVSTNYAIGGTRDKAISHYGDIFSKKLVVHETN